MARISVAEGMTDALAQPGEPGHVAPEPVAEPPDPMPDPGQGRGPAPEPPSPPSPAPKAARAAPKLSGDG